MKGSHTVMGLTRTDAGKTYPLVSIGLPVYNGERFIARCLESLCAQDYPNFEIIVSDNRSKDRTVAICEEYAARHPFIRIHRQPENQGVQKNFIKTLELARGDYFFWAGVDDLWMPGFMRALVEDLEHHPEAQLSMTAFERVYEDGTLYDTQRFGGKDSPNDRSPFGTLCLVTSPRKLNLFLYGLFRRDFLKRAVRYFPDVPAWDRVFMTMVALSAPVRCVNTVLHRHTLHKASLTDRYPDEQVFRKKNGRQYRFLYTGIVKAMCRICWNSDLVPWARKWYLLPGLVHYTFYVMAHQVRLPLRALRKSLGQFKLRIKLERINHRLIKRIAEADMVLAEVPPHPAWKRSYWAGRRAALIMVRGCGRVVFRAMIGLRERMRGRA